MDFQKAERNNTAIYYGWWVVLGVVAIEVIGPMGRYCMSAFFPYISSELDWSRTLIGYGQTVSLWVYAVCVPFTGWMVDRVGGRKTFLLGGCLTILAWLLVATTKMTWHLFVYYGLIMGVAVSLCHMVTAQATVNKWFTRRAGLVTGLTSAAFGLGVSLFVPAITYMAHSIGWRMTSVVYGTISGCVILVIAWWVIKDTPESAGFSFASERAREFSERNLADRPPPVRRVFMTVPFWLLFVAYSMVGIPLQGMLGHLVMWGVDVGASRAASGAFVSAMFLPSLISKIGAGWLGDRLGKKRVILSGELFCLALMLWGWNSVHGSQSLMAFSILMGFGYGLPMGLFAPYLSTIYGRGNVGFLFGALTTGHGLIGGCGPLIWGSLFDSYGRYNSACLLSALCYGVAAIAVLFIKSGAGAHPVAVERGANALA